MMNKLLDLIPFGSSRADFRLPVQQADGVLIHFGGEKEGEVSAVELDSSRITIISP